MSICLIDVRLYLSNLMVVNMTPRKAKQTQTEKTDLVRVSFEVSKEIRSEFKAKLALENQTLREVFVDFMKKYIKKNP